MCATMLLYNFHIFKLHTFKIVWNINNSLVRFVRIFEYEQKTREYISSIKNLSVIKISQDFERKNNSGK